MPSNDPQPDVVLIQKKHAGTVWRASDVISLIVAWPRSWILSFLCVFVWISWSIYIYYHVTSHNMIAVHFVINNSKSIDKNHCIHIMINPCVCFKLWFKEWCPDMFSTICFPWCIKGVNILKDASWFVM